MKKDSWLVYFLGIHKDEGFYPYSFWCDFPLDCGRSSSASSKNTATANKKHKITTIMRVMIVLFIVFLLPLSWGRRMKKSSPCKSCELEVESLQEPSGSNDGSFLEYLCSLMIDNVDDCPPKYDNWLCPNSYEIPKICSMNQASVVAADDNDGGALMAQWYCTPLFANLADTPCAGFCKTYVAICCELECPP